MLVVRCALTPQEDGDWLRAAIFHTYLKCNEWSCKLIIDSGSCTNVVYSGTIAHLGLKAEPHPRLFRISWLGSTSISVTHRCFVPLQFYSY